MKDTSRMIVSALTAAAAFLVLFLLLHWNLIICVLLCVGIYFGLFFLLKPSRKIAGIDVESMPGGEEIQKLLNDAQADLADIDKAVKAIAAPSVQRDAGALYATGTRILAYLKENPDKIKLARPFLYLLSGYGHQAAGAICGFSEHGAPFGGGHRYPAKDGRSPAGAEQRV